MTPKQVRIMAAYFEASGLADATDAMVQAHAARRAGLLGNCGQFSGEDSPCPISQGPRRVRGSLAQAIKALTIGHAAAWPLANTSAYSLASQGYGKRCCF